MVFGLLTVSDVVVALMLKFLFTVVDFQVPKEL